MTKYLIYRSLLLVPSCCHAGLDRPGKGAALAKFGKNSDRPSVVGWSGGRPQAGDGGERRIGDAGSKGPVLTMNNTLSGTVVSHWSLACWRRGTTVVVTGAVGETPCI